MPTGQLAAIGSDAEAQTIGAAGASALRDGLQRLIALETLPDKPEETSQSALRALWHLAAGRRLSADAALETPLPALDDAGITRFGALLERRMAGTPLAHLTERQRFMGIEMLAGPGALIPRRETELVARAAAELAQRIAAQNGAVRVMDVCTGSANVALAIAIAEPRATVFASDLSEEAVELARLNVAHAGLENRVTLRSGDLLAPFDEPEFVGTIDLLTCNPPYISSGRVDQLPAEIGGHEPRLAFDGGPLGVRILQRLIREAPRMLVPGGWLAFEVGLGQGKSVAQRMRSSGAYASVEPVEDERGETRVLIARAT